MQIRAYVLIRVSGNSKCQVVAAVRKLEGIESAGSVSGIYDVIAVAQSKDLNGIADLVVSKILRISGVISTETCLTVDKEEALPGPSRAF